MIKILVGFSVVCVGGDGMFSELMHGMLTRSMREAGLDHLAPAHRPIPPKLRIGIIPGGEWASCLKRHYLYFARILYFATITSQPMSVHPS